MFRLIHFTLPLALAVLSASVVRAVPAPSAAPPQCPAVNNHICIKISCSATSRCGALGLRANPNQYRISNACRTVSGKLDCAKQCLASSQCQSFLFYEFNSPKTDPGQNKGPGTCTLYSVPVNQLSLVDCLNNGPQKNCKDAEYKYYDASAFADTGFYLQTSSSNADYNNLYAAQNPVGHVTNLGYAQNTANALLFSLDSASTLQSGTIVINQDADTGRPDEPIYLDSQGGTSTVGVIATVDSALNVALSSGQRNVLFANADRYGNYIGLGKDTGVYSDLALKAVCPA